MTSHYHAMFYLRQTGIYLTQKRLLILFGAKEIINFLEQNGMFEAKWCLFKTKWYLNFL